MKTKTKTRVLSLLLTLAMLLTSFVVVIPASAAETGWDGTAAESFANGVKYGDEGAGTKDNPYKISTPAEFAYFAKTINDSIGTSKTVNYNGLYVVLTTDIDLNKVPISPIGSAKDGNIFRGTFDGQGYAVKNISLTIKDNAQIYNSATDKTTGVTTHTAYCGLFVRLTGTMKNVTFNFSKFDVTQVDKATADGKNVNGNFSVGVLGGQNNSHSDNFFENVTVSGNAKVTFLDKGFDFGVFMGVVAFAANARNFSFVNCKTDMNVTLTSDVAGTTRIGMLLGCYNTANPNVTMSAVNCELNANITLAKGGANRRVGTLFGVLQNKGIKQLDVIGNIYGGRYTGTANNAADLVGYTNSALTSVNIVAYEKEGELLVDGANRAPLASSYTQIGVKKSYKDGTMTVEFGKAGWDKLAGTYSNLKLAYGDKMLTEGVANADESAYIFTFEEVEAGKDLKIVSDTLSFVINNKAISAWSAFQASSIQGDGDTEATAYEISTAGELAYYMATIAPGTTAYAKLTKSIDLGGLHWDLNAGHGSTVDFSGTFDGQGNTISNLTAMRNARFVSVAKKNMYTNGVALFGQVCNGKILNLNLTAAITANNVHVASQNGWIGALANSLYASETLVDNCNVTFNVNGTVLLNQNQIGVIAGYITEGAIISNTTANGNITFSTDTQSYIGGFIGRGNYGTIKNCINNANITFKQTKTTANTSIVGGIVGATDATAGKYMVIKNTVNTGVLTITGKVNARLGGIIGNAGRSTYIGAYDIQNCFNLGKLYLNTELGSGGVSGIVGMNEIKSANDATELIIKNNFSADYGIIYNATGSDAPQIDGADAPAAGKLPVGNAELGVTTTSKDGIVTVAVSQAAWELLTAGKGINGKVVYGSTVKTTADNYDDGAYYFVFTEVNDATAALVVDDGAGWSYTIAPNNQAGWSAFAADSFAGGDGLSAETAYEIETPAQFALMAQLVNNYDADARKAYYKLTASFDVSAHEWTPVQQLHNGNLFAGFVDGNYQTITGVRLTQDTYKYSQSMFGSINGGEIKNLYIDGVDIETAKLKGTVIFAPTTLVGSMYGGNITNVHVTNLDMDYVATEAYHFAGLVGYFVSQNSVISNSSVQGAIDIEAACDSLEVSGFVNRARMGHIENCVADVDITVINNAKKDGDKLSYVRAGGFVSYVFANANTEIVYIDSCVNYGDITVTTNKGNYNATVQQVAVSGFVAGASVNSSNNSGALYVSNSVNVGKLTATSDVEGVTVVGAILGNDTFTTADGGYKTIDEVNTKVNEIVKIDKCLTMTNNAFVGRLSANGGRVIEGETDTNKNVKESLKLGIADGARVRIAADCLTKGSGLRFDGKVDLEVLEQLKAAYGAANVEVGITITTIENYNAVKGDWSALVEGVKTGKIEVTATTFNQVAADKVGTVDDYQFAGSIVNLFESNYNRQFVATSYLTITIAEGVTVTVYADVDVARTMADVADAAIKDHYDDSYGTSYSEEALELLAKYAAAND